VDQTRTEASVRPKGDTETRSEARGEDTQRVGSMEINLGDFTRTVVLMKSLRLMLNNQIAVPVDDLASGVGEAGRKFKMGDLEQANQDVARLYSAFGQKTNQWESQARRLEQQMKMQSAKDPKSISINRMNEMKSEQIAVRTRIRTAEVQFRRLHQGLEQAYTILQNQPAPATDETPGASPLEVPASFKAAAMADRPVIVKEHFDVEAILKVNVTKSATGGYDVRFEPMPPLERVYFLTKTAQLIRLQQLGKVVRFQDLETGQEAETKLAEFVKHVQGGVWLLEARS
jgi:hypothetical protein